MSKTMKSLMDAKPNEVVKLKYDNAESGDFWILFDGYRVTIAEQKIGEDSTQWITVPIKEFRKLIRAFIKEQPIRGASHDD